jgi:hypothetical protein
VSAMGQRWRSAPGGHGHVSAMGQRWRSAPGGHGIAPAGYRNRASLVGHPAQPPTAARSPDEGFWRPKRHSSRFSRVGNPPCPVLLAVVLVPTRLLDLFAHDQQFGRLALGLAKPLGHAKLSFCLFLQLVIDFRNRRCATWHVDCNVLIVSRNAQDSKP